MLFRRLPPARDDPNWVAARSGLDEAGWAVLPGLLDREACLSAAALWRDESRFRSRVVMARHGFGQGEYRYFASPLPEPVAGDTEEVVSDQSVESIGAEDALEELPERRKARFTGK